MAALHNTRRVRWSLSLLGVVTFLFAWYLAADVFEVLSDIVLPSPFLVLSEFQRVRPLIVDNLWPTLRAGAVGFSTALLGAVVVAVLLTASDRLRRATMPIIIAVNSVPRVSLAPLIIFYVGEGQGANYVIAAWIAFFPMLINTVDGLVNVDEDTENLLAVIGATTWQEYRYVRFVRATPHIFDGMKTGVTLAIIGAVVGEFVAANEGIGFLALFALYNVNIALVLAIVGVMGFVTLLLVFGLYAIESRLIFWKDVSLFRGETR